MNILIIEDEKDIAEILEGLLMEADDGTHRISLAHDGKTALEKLSRLRFDLVLSDLHMPEYNGIEALQNYVPPQGGKKPYWVFISADGSSEMLQKVTRLGASDLVQKPFRQSDIEQVLERLKNKGSDPLLELMKVVQEVSGVQLGPEKRLLVETRIMRRARQLGMNSLATYLNYFLAHRDSEMKEVVAVVTTHTTEFFREADHFDYLLDKVLPQLGKRKIRIWSAASSTGEEVYSLAISCYEYAREKGMTSFDFEVLGTDIDFNSVEKAKNGVYLDAAVSKVHPSLVKRYFDVGAGDLAGKIRIKDFVHKHCQFKQLNLFSETYPDGLFDVIFLRNVLIYFKSGDVEKIGQKMMLSLKPDGFLFLGHSESLSGLKVNAKTVGNSVYQHPVQVEEKQKRGNQGVGQSLGSGSSNKRDSGVKVAEPVVQTDIDKSRPIRVFIVDDSLTIRAHLKKILVPQHGFEVVGEAVNPIEAERVRKAVSYDVMTLDIHMPEMDGVSYLEKLKNEERPPIVMLSSISYEDATSALHCLELGAVDYIEKPQGLNLDKEAERIRATLRGAVQSKKINRDFKQVTSNNLLYDYSDRDLVLIGASTGGVEAITALLSQFPKNSPPVLIVQHIPAHFSKVFADRLASICKIKVKEAADGDIVQGGTAYVAPGGMQMGVIYADYKMVIKLSDSEPVNRHKPAVDYLFDSVVKVQNRFQISAALLTGMGADGARGLKTLRDGGAHTIAQNEETSVVFGMPQEAIKLGAAVEVLPLMSISYHLLKALQKQKAA